MSLTVTIYIIGLLALAYALWWWRKLKTRNSGLVVLYGAVAVLPNAVWSLAKYLLIVPSGVVVVVYIVLITLTIVFGALFFWYLAKS